MKASFKVGEFSFSVDCPDELYFPHNMQIFQIPTDNQTFSYKINLADSFPKPHGRLVTDRENLQVYDLDGLETRVLRLKGSNKLYGMYQEESSQHAEIFYSSDMIHLFHLDPVFISLLALEKHILSNEGIVLHCAYIERHEKAVLFSAPSETGKTTQANLWEKYRNTRTVNGDRSLLRKINGIWHACGWPVCGTSGVCNNQNLPIEAIVMLSQAKENEIHALQGLNAFSNLYSQIMINRWNDEDHQKSMNLIEDLIKQIPVYHLACNISEDAVLCLEQALNREKSN